MLQRGIRCGSGAGLRRSISFIQAGTSADKLSGDYRGLKIKFLVVSVRGQVNWSVIDDELQGQEARCALMNRSNG